MVRPTAPPRPKRENDPDLLDEYDFSGGVRGKYAQRYREGTHLVRLDDDVAAIFPTAEEVVALDWWTQDRE